MFDAGIAFECESSENEIAFSEYAMALGYELLNKDPNMPADDLLYEFRSSLLSSSISIRSTPGSEIMDSFYQRLKEQDPDTFSKALFSNLVDPRSSELVVQFWPNRRIQITLDFASLVSGVCARSGTAIASEIVQNSRYRCSNSC